MTIHHALEAALDFIESVKFAYGDDSIHDDASQALALLEGGAGLDDEMPERTEEE